MSVPDVEFIFQLVNGVQTLNSLQQGKSLYDP